MDTSSLLYNAKSVHKVFELTIGSEDCLSHLKGKKRCNFYLQALSDGIFWRANVPICNYMKCFSKITLLR